MKRFFFLTLLAIFTLGMRQTKGQLPGEDGKIPAVVWNYFPDRMHAFVFRNWTMVPVDRLAKVLDTTVERVNALASSLGLPPQKDIEKQWLTSNGYITVLRANWNLLNYDQILVLLDLDRNELAWRLKEDDFLYVKLGLLKPFCSPLHYKMPDEETQDKVKQFAGWVKEINAEAFAPEIPRFSFYKEFPLTLEGQIPEKKSHQLSKSPFDIRMVSSYCAEFGDPLMDAELRSYPEGLLKRLSEVGINAIWLHTVLNTLVQPDGLFPGSEDAPRRLEGLTKLVRRAGKYGIKIYLYMNEPRAMEKKFYHSEPDRMAFKGIDEADYSAMCTSVPAVRYWLTQSLKKVFTQVKGLGGIFTITGSENLTSCISHQRQADCERCNKKSYADTMIELITAMHEGVRSGNPEAKVIVWDWGWNDQYSESIIRGIPKSCILMSVSEWSLPIERGGIKSVVGEYSISSVGPGPRALKHWGYARDAGLKTMAKVQVNCTWEMSIVPSLPTLNLVAEHAEKLSKESVNSTMLSWSLGGYPSVNLELFQKYHAGGMEKTLDELALKYYGAEASPFIRKAWSVFSEGFKEYPYHLMTVYFGPQHMGPSNPFYSEPTRMRSTMVGIPYDDLESWRGVFPAEVWADQMQKVAGAFEEGCAILQGALPYLKRVDKEKIITELNRATAVGIHCSSAANQARFIISRDACGKTAESMERRGHIQNMKNATHAELKLVKRMMPILKNDPYIAFEATNHYYYVPQDLLEKYINLKSVLAWLDELK